MQIFWGMSRLIQMRNDERDAAHQNTGTGTICIHLTALFVLSASIVRLLYSFAFTL